MPGVLITVQFCTTNCSPTDVFRTTEETDWTRYVRANKTFCDWNYEQTSGKYLHVMQSLYIWAFFFFKILKIVIPWLDEMWSVFLVQSHPCSRSVPTALYTICYTGPRYEGTGLWNIHYSDVIMTTMASQITSLTFIQAQIKENFTAPRHWPLCGEFTGTGEFPAQRASYAASVSIWWRHHDHYKITGRMLLIYSRNIDIGLIIDNA